MKALTACLLVFVVLANFGCSVALEGKARASLFAPLNREVKQSSADAIAEGQIVGALIVEAGGETFLAEAYLTSRGYSDAQVAERIAIARARGATAAARMSKQ